jgi:sigma-B regulation protein RsbU (phosphoserine phosphatase)
MINRSNWFYKAAVRLWPDVADVDGWQLAAVLESARQKSGDFYDFMPLENNHLGILVADVSDKGTGAALYMALSRTLIRTYAMAHPNQPEVAFTLANERIMADAQSEQFVTVFYGVLDCSSGILTYANAGHNPPYLIRGSNGRVVQALGRTGLLYGCLKT